MNPVKNGILILAILDLIYDSALAAPSALINIPSTDAKGLNEVAIGINNYTRFSDKADAGLNSYSAGIETGLLPFEAIKLEVGIDYVTTGTNSSTDTHPFYFNAKLTTAEDLGVKGLPAFAVGVYNMGTYDKPEIGVSTRQNIAYVLAAKTLPVVGRISVGGYVAAERALRTYGNPLNNNSGVMASWDRTISELSEKLWLGADYMSGNNANGEISFGASWSFTKQVTLLAGVVWYNPFYKLSTADKGMLPGGKPAFTTQLTINLP
jgi:hypothetical protein